MKNKRRGNLNGAVLIMVLTVMFVLIIMLMATLTVVSTASQRIYTKYEENQAYYTARSALDVFAEKMLNDAKLEAAVGSTQGYELQKKLYSVIVHNNATDDNPQGDGTEASGKNNVIYDAVDKDYIEYKVDLPKLAGNVSGKLYSNFSDNDGVKIKVEVIDRNYDPTGDRKKDMMRIKVTSTATVQGVESTAAAIFGSKKPPANTAERAVTITGNNNMDVSNTTILGGLATLTGSFKMGNQGDYWGNVFIGGTVDVSGSGSRMVNTDDQWIYLENGVSTQNNLPIQGRLAGTDLSKTPNMYVNGDFEVKNNMTTGYNSGDSSSKPIKIIIAGNLNSQNSNQYTHYGDLLVLGDVKTGLQFTVDGNMYVMGNCDFDSSQNGVNISGNLYVSGTFKAPKDPNTGKYKSNIKIGSSGTTGLNQTAPPESIVSISGNDYAADPETAPDDWDGNIIVKWNNVEHKIPAKQRLYTQFYRYGDINDGTITASEYAFLSEEELEKIMDTTATTFEYPEDFKRIHEYYNANSADLVSVSILASDTITDSTKKYVLSPGHCGGGTLTVDAGGEVELFIMPGSYSNGGTILVKNGSVLKIFGIPGQYYFDKIKVYTEEVANGNDLYVGETAPSGKSLMNMPISYYFEGESIININNSGSLFVGHFYAPRATVNVSGGVQLASTTDVYYNGVKYDKTTPEFTFVGSLLCENYTVGDAKGSVAFVKGAASVNTPGLPQLTFIPIEYSRR